MKELKKALSKNLTLHYFCMNKETEMFVDASPIGLCAILTQKEPNKEERKVIHFASRALTPTESRYSQTEREALGIVWGCEHFHLYLYGAPFKVITDHKPLVSMFGNHRAQLPPRIERWAMRLQPYKMTVEYQSGESNPADYLSRHPIHKHSSSRESKVAEEYVQYLVDNSTPKAMKLEDVAAATLEDQTLKVVIKALETGKWYEARIEENVPLNSLYSTLQKCRHELSLAHNNSVILKGSRIVVPAKLQQQAINIAHSGHQGIVKTVALLREKVWFKGMNNSVEETVKNCQHCQVATPTTTREPLQMSPLPSAPWMEVSADFGQVAEGTYILVVQDEYSRYVIVDVLSSLTARSVVPRFDKIFSEFGVPAQLKTDNGPPFNSSEFASYLSNMGIHHRKITPLWPRANAETERFMRTIKKVVRGKPLNWKQEMHKLLLAYRATPHTSTGMAPATVLFGRDIRTKLPSLAQTPKIDSDLRATDTKAKEIMKQYADQKIYVKPSNLQVGDDVLVKSTDVAKSKLPYQQEPLTVVAKKGSMITAKRGEQILSRNSSFFKKSPMPPAHRDMDPMESQPVPETSHQEVEHAPPVKMLSRPETAPPPEASSRPRRDTQVPGKYKDFVMK